MQLRTDWASEMDSQSTKEVLKRHKIGLRHSAPYSPHQMGVAERRNRTVIGMARTILRRSGLPIEFWSFAVHYSCYVLNRCDSSALKGMTPHEAKIGKRPNVDDLHPFGCDAWVKIEKGQLFQGKRREKWDPVAQKAIFLGCCDVSPSYYCLILDTKKVVRSRNVLFEEKSFDHVRILRHPRRVGAS